jgi:hypothetical protein
MVTRLKLVLEQAEYSALLKMAAEELRDPADQVRQVLREKLMQRGLLPSVNATPNADAIKTQQPGAQYANAV